ncbi:MAG: alpha-L-rhamnosidase C-terminal domain-containing protein [Bacteroidota bacterium]
MKFFPFAFYLLLLGFNPSFAQNRPTALLTDLLQHTEVVLVNGYLSSVELQNMDGAIEPVQYDEIRSSRPSFSWIVPGKENNTVQTAYQIIVADSFKDALAFNGTVWDSKKTMSNQSVSVPYGGELLKPGHTYFWRVRSTTNRAGESEWSAIKAFRTAKELALYAASYEQLRKTAEHPSSLNKVSAGMQLADFGKDAFGQLSVQLSSETGLDTVRLHLGEVLDGQGVNRKPGGTIRYQKFTLALQKGTHLYRLKIAKDARNTGPAAIKMTEQIGEVMPFRYAEIEGYSKTLTTNELIREFVHYPFDDSASSFKSSDEQLNRIWDLCKYSMKATSFSGVYVDGDRERIPYEADALINQLGHYGVDREYSLARRSSEYLLKHPTWPTEWIMQALIISWNDYLYTGDARSLTANYELLKSRTLTQLTEKNGLISTNTGLQTPAFAASINFKDKIKDIVDWPLSETDGFVFTAYNAVTNAYHYKALVLMEQIAKIVHPGEDEQRYRTAQEAFKKAYNKHFFDAKTAIYKDGDTTMHSSLHTNMFALHFGLVPDQYKKSVLQFIRSRGMACSVYGSQFLMDALYDGRDGTAALALLTARDERSWYNMIKVGSTITLEAWDNKFKPNQDWNHAWGAAPANLIPRRLMGVEPLTPGFGSVSIRPQIGNLKFAQAEIPTIRGGIQISVTQEDTYTLKFTLPANMDAEVYLPVRKGKVFYNGKPIRAKADKDFLYAGKFGSGTHEFVVKDH